MTDKPFSPTIKEYDYAYLFTVGIDVDINVAAAFLSLQKFAAEMMDDAEVSGDTPTIAVAFKFSSLLDQQQLSDLADKIAGTLKEFGLKPTEVQLIHAEKLERPHEVADPGTVSPI